jgi:hypothetical protein
MIEPHIIYAGVEEHEEYSVPTAWHPFEDLSRPY